MANDPSRPITCAECGIATIATHNAQKYCSSGCVRAATNARRRAQASKQVVITCEVCGGSYTRSAVNPSEHCRCAKCRALRGADHPGWRGGWFNKVLGRYVVTTPDGRQMYRARWVVEQDIGRPLRSDEDVHHRNRDKTDDRLANLQVVSRSEHLRLHAEDRRRANAARREHEWSREHVCCEECGTTDGRHMGRGLCKACYSRAWRAAKRAA